MDGRKYQRKSGIKRTLVMLLALVMLASVCFPAMRVNAEGNPDVTVTEGNTESYSVEGLAEDANVTVTVPDNSDLAVTYDNGVFTVNAASAKAGTYTVDYAYQDAEGADQSASFTVTVAEAENDNTPQQPQQQPEQPQQQPEQPQQQSEQPQQQPEQPQQQPEQPQQQPEQPQQQPQQQPEQPEQPKDVVPVEGERSVKAKEFDDKIATLTEQVNSFAGTLAEYTALEAAIGQLKEDINASNASSELAEGEGAGLLTQAEDLLKTLAPKKPEEEQDPEDVELSAVDKLFNRLMSASTFEELDEMMENMTEEEYAFKAQFTEEQNTKLAAYVNALSSEPVVTLEAERVEQGGDPVTIGLTFGYYLSPNKFKIDGFEAEYDFGRTASGIKVSYDSRNERIIVTATEDATPGPHTIEVGRRGWGGYTYYTTVYIEVVEKSTGGDAGGQETSNTLYIYTLIPGKQLTDTQEEDPDNVWNGMGLGSVTGNSPSKIAVDTIVTDGDAAIDEAIDNGKINLPPSFPDISVSGKTYQYATTEDQKYQEGYYTITWIRVVVSNGANAGNNNYNQTVASGTHTYHLDGILTLNEVDRYTVNFFLEDAGKTGFALVDPENYSKRVNQGTPESTLNRPQLDPEKTVNGITYVFDGWYYDEACTRKANFTGTITENTNYYARYIPKPTTLIIKKEFSGLDDNAAKPQTVTVKVTGPDYEKSVDLSNANNYEATLSDLKLFETYTVREIADGIDVENYDLETTYSVTNGAIELTQNTSDNVVTITNTYTKKAVDVTITKTVSGNMGDTNKEFTFEVTSDKAMSTGEGYTLSNENKTANFKLKHNQSITLKGVPIDAKLTVTEKDADAYSVTIDGGDPVKAQGITGDAFKSNITVTEGKTITVVNRNEATIDTGIVTDSIPYILLLTMAVIGAGVLLLNKRRVF